MKPPAQGGYLRTIVLAITSVISALIPSVNSLRAQSTYYRVHYPEFLAIVETLTSLPSEYIIAAPKHGVAMQRLQSTRATILKPEDVVFSEDNDTLVISEETENKLSVILGTLVDKNENKVKDYPFTIKYDGNYLVNVFDEGTPYYRLEKYIDENTLDGEFRVVYDQTPGNEGLLQLKTHLRINNNPDNARLNIVYAKGESVTTERFRIISNTSKQISIYRKDYFNIQPVDKATPVDNDKRIGLQFGSNPNIDADKPQYYHYILNDGSKVSVDDLMQSPGKITYEANNTSTPNRIYIPYDGVSTTLWVMPVMDGYAGMYNDSPIKSAPVGRIVKIEVAKGGDTTGIDDIKTDGTNYIPQYFTIQGHPVNPPLAPGIYIKREGDKSTKILVK